MVGLSSLGGVRSLPEFIEVLNRNESYEAIAQKTGIGATTLRRAAAGQQVSPDTLDRLAEYAGVTRERVYSIAYGLSLPKRISPTETVELVARILEGLPPEVQRLFLTQVRAVADNYDDKPQ